MQCNTNRMAIVKASQLMNDPIAAHVRLMLSIQYILYRASGRTVERTGLRSVAQFAVTGVRPLTHQRHTGTRIKIGWRARARGSGCGEHMIRDPDPIDAHAARHVMAGLGRRAVWGVACV